MNTYRKLLVLFAAAFIISVRATAQDPGGNPGDPDGVPLDGGLSIAIVAGVGYGAKKLMKKKQ